MKNLTKIQRRKLNNVFKQLSDNRISFDQIEQNVKFKEHPKTGIVNEFIRDNSKLIVLILETIKILTPTLIDTIIDKIIEYITENY